MYTPEQMSRYVFPFKFTCSECKGDLVIDRIGISCGGDLVVFVTCTPCDDELAFHLDYDYFMTKSHNSLVEELLKT